MIDTRDYETDCTKTKIQAKSTCDLENTFFDKHKTRRQPTLNLEIGNGSLAFELEIPYYPQFLKSTRSEEEAAYARPIEGHDGSPTFVTNTTPTKLS